MSMNASWKHELKSLITDPKELLELLEIEPTSWPGIESVSEHFPLRVTRSFVTRMQKGNIEDPLLKQVLPLNIESEIEAGFSLDPLSEMQHNPVSGLLHKYHGRVLMTITGGCAIHCRYCFRRHFPYQENIPGKKLDGILNYIAKHEDIHEVILSGGDPLMVSDHYLNTLIQELSKLPHLRIIRIHSRLPIVLPQRITSALIESLTTSRLQMVMVIHTNHANEIDDTVRNTLLHLSNAGIILFNQTVLLKTINDSVEALQALSYALLRCRVTPYYLHCLDKVQGAAHFDVDLKTAKQLYYQLRQCLPGYLVPLLVREEPYAKAKSPMI
jgi:EF-P beta-lysylation protein EpmB